LPPFYNIEVKTSFRVSQSFLLVGSPHMSRIAAMVLAVLLSNIAHAAEYIEKTPFQLSRAFSPGVVTSGGMIGWIAGQTPHPGQPRQQHRQQFRSAGKASVFSNRRRYEARRREPGQHRDHDGVHQGIPLWR
jgi:hypothetical protein